MIKLFKEKYGYDPRELEDPSSDEKWLQFRCDQITEVANEIAGYINIIQKPDYHVYALESLRFISILKQ
jgi:hypothetical protein